MSVEHYENFPVASILLPAYLRPAVTAIYWFARTADDIADEGQADEAQRLAQLAAYRAELDKLAAALARGDAGADWQTPWAPLFARLLPHVRAHGLPLQAFYDLLDAFAQDVVKARYADYPEVLDYCRRSANPVGQLMLHLYRAATPDNLARSDAICTALQLINFWQDVAVDWQKGTDVTQGRVYLPQADLRQFGLDESWIAQRRADAPWTALMDFQIQRTRELMLSGAPLVHALPGRLGWELRLMVQGGLRILEKTQRVRGDVFRHRPTLNKFDLPLLCWRAFSM